MKITRVDHIPHILEERRPIPPYQKRRAVVCVGRWQPPTKGHGRTINAARAFYRDAKLDAIVVVIIAGTETSKDKSRNPLSANQRMRYLKASRYGNGVVYLTATNAFEAFIAVREAGYEPYAVAGGRIVDSDVGEVEDRPSAYKEMLDKYFVGPDGKNYNHPAVSLERDLNSTGSDGVSGTAARDAVAAADYEAFRSMVDIEEDDIVERMYRDIKRSLESHQE
jgi:nicotinamide mononucleotide adenylyltransferase